MQKIQPQKAPTELAADLDNLLPRALAYLADVVPYDLAAVLVLTGDTLQVRCARGPLATPKVRDHQLSLAQLPVVRMALDTRRTRVVRAHDHAAEGDPYDNVLDLPHGHACMVVPLYFGDTALGVLTFDRTVCELYPPKTVELATIFGQVIALAMIAAETASISKLQRLRLARVNQRLVDQMEAPDPAWYLRESRDPTIRRLGRLAEQVARTDAPLLILGEPGAGKSSLARAIHRLSSRREGPWIALHCATLSEAGQAESFALAEGGTLLLQGVDSLSLTVQQQFLRILPQANFRLIATCTELALAEAHLCPEFCHLLEAFPLTVPPLRARPDDIPLLVEEILRATTERTGRGPWTVGAQTMQRLVEHDWPGNVRELVNLLERALLLAPSGPLELDVFRSRRRREPRRWQTLQEVEKDYIERVLQETGGKIYGTGGAAELLGLKPSTLQSRMVKLGIRR